jgi:hypothetical protein
MVTHQRPRRNSPSLLDQVAQQAVKLPLLAVVRLDRATQIHQERLVKTSTNQREKIEGPDETSPIVLLDEVAPIAQNLPTLLIGKGAKEKIAAKATDLTARTGKAASVDRIGTRTGTRTEKETRMVTSGIEVIEIRIERRTMSAVLVVVSAAKVGEIEIPKVNIAMTRKTIRRTARAETVTAVTVTKTETRIAILVEILIDVRRDLLVTKSGTEAIATAKERMQGKQKTIARARVAMRQHQKPRRRVRSRYRALERLVRSSGLPILARR